MKSLTGVLLVAFVSSGAFASEPGQPATKDTTTPPVSAQSKAASQVRQAEDSDLIVKEWHSPITFDLDAGWLRTLPFGETADIEDLPSFYCDGVTVHNMKVTKSLQRKSGVVQLHIEFQLRARRQRDDKAVALEFTFLNGEQRLRLGRLEDLSPRPEYRAVGEITYNIPKEMFAAYTADGSSPQLRVTMIAIND